ncbi:hypothetical protein F5884DRAFT_73907 [Xylogone sp. PMI_703]|nr:hypothetical protein F5884DRAFT_73907 [Xylogone sp. PMI_703]
MLSPLSPGIGGRKANSHLNSSWSAFVSSLAASTCCCCYSCTAQEPTIVEILSSLSAALSSTFLTFHAHSPPHPPSLLLSLSRQPANIPTNPVCTVLALFLSLHQISNLSLSLCSALACLRRSCYPAPLVPRASTTTRTAQLSRAPHLHPSTQHPSTKAPSVNLHLLQLLSNCRRTDQASSSWQILGLAALSLSSSLALFPLSPSASLCQRRSGHTKIHQDLSRLFHRPHPHSSGIQEFDRPPPPTH